MAMDSLTAFVIISSGIKLLAESIKIITSNSGFTLFKTVINVSVNLLNLFIEYNYIT